MIDTADMYYGGESERIIGKALKENGKRRQVDPGHQGRLAGG